MTDITVPRVIFIIASFHDVNVSTVIIRLSPGMNLARNNMTKMDGILVISIPCSTAENIFSACRVRSDQTH